MSIEGMEVCVCKYSIFKFSSISYSSIILVVRGTAKLTEQANETVDIAQISWPRL